MESQMRSSYLLLTETEYTGDFGDVEKASQVFSGVCQERADAATGAD
ncbi:hypothetical protein H5A43_18805 [Pectobacterium brasiliense]|nr:hypothetical protein [Pectobacterium brasiliense]